MLRKVDARLSRITALLKDTLYRVYLHLDYQWQSVVIDHCDSQMARFGHAKPYRPSTLTLNAKP